MKCFAGHSSKCEAAPRSAGCHGRRQLVVRGAHAQKEVSRRGLVEITAGVGLALAGAPPALAKVPKGFQAVRDTGDGYEFLFPFGWQEVSVSGVDTVYKDVIEPLESVSVQLTVTEKASITDYGPVNEVAGTLASSVLARSSDEVQLIKSTTEEADGRDYFAFEFLQKSSRFTRHVVAVATVANGKLILFTTGAKESRWGKMKDKLTKSVESFKAFNVYKQ